MNAIILTEEQAAQLVAARGPNDIRILEPRRLQDGRLILNADILDDPFFADPARPWAAILTGQEIIPDSGPRTQDSELETAVITTGLAQAKSQIVTLTAADLAESE